jgi:hypothetical protein
MTGTIVFAPAATCFTKSETVRDNVTPEEFEDLVRMHSENRCARTSARIIGSGTSHMSMIAPGENGGVYEWHAKVAA